MRRQDDRRRWWLAGAALLCWVLLNGWGAPAVLYLDDGSGVDGSRTDRWLGEVASALVADDGTLYFAGRQGVSSVHRPARDGTSVVTEFRHFATLPTDDPKRVRGLTADRAGRGWVLLGTMFVPVRLTDGLVHPLAAELQPIARRTDGADLPGATPPNSRWIGAVAVVDDGELLISSTPNRPFVEGVGNGLLHRLRTDGTRELLAGRTTPPDQPVRRAAALPIGREVPATEVNLDLITTIQPLPGGGVLLVCPPPRSPISLRPLETATFLLLRHGMLSRLPVSDIVTGWTEPLIHTSVAADGRVLVNARLHDDIRHQVAFLLDPVTGDRLWVGRGIEIDTSHGTTVLVADGTDLVTLAGPAMYPDDRDRHHGMVRVVRQPLPSRA